MTFSLRSLVSKKNIFALLVVIIMAGLIGGVVYFYLQYQKVLKDPTLVSSQETQTILTQLTKFIELPAEQPTLATITDIKPLADQEFFKNAQNGDKILVYATARKAILYRPSTQRIINFAPLSITPDATTQATQSSEIAVPNPVAVTILNGSTVAGLTSNAEAKLKYLSGVAVVSKGNAAKTDYAQTLVVDVTGDNSELAKKVATLLGGTVGNIPEGETKPSSGLLVIVTN